MPNKQNNENNGINRNSNDTSNTYLQDEEEEEEEGVFLRRITFLRYDYASDAWSFGVTLYEMAMLAPPFKGLNICQAAKAEG